MSIIVYKISHYLFNLCLIFVSVRIHVLFLKVPSELMVSIIERTKKWYWARKRSLNRSITSFIKWINKFSALIFKMVVLLF